VHCSVVLERGILDEEKLLGEWRCCGEAMTQKRRDLFDEILANQTRYRAF